MRGLSSLLERHGFQIRSKASVCFVPGFLLTYRLPFKSLQHAIVSAVRRAEPLMSRAAPGNGYLLVMAAVKKPA
jgi:hypothetical protein